MAKSRKQGLTPANAVRRIDERGALLVFPINNKPEPKSLWSEFHPRTPMRWEWDDDGDNRVASLWHLMKRLSESRDVVYSKWYQGRATFFSRELFAAMLTVLRQRPRTELSETARLLLETLESDSPLSTKELKRLTELQGKANEALYARALKELFSRGLIVAFGEVDDGAFPSLAVGATELLFEDLWVEAGERELDEAQAVIDRFIPKGSLFRRQLEKI